MTIHTTAIGKITGSLQRGRRTIARFSARIRRRTQEVTITLRGPVPPGRYRVILTTAQPDGPLISSRTIRISA